MDAKPTFHHYMRAYGEDHRHRVNRLMHLVGIPLIVLSLAVALLSLRVGLLMFGLGWALQFVGHAFEGKAPSFSRDWKYLAIGPVWIANEWVELLTGMRLYRVRSGVVR